MKEITTKHICDGCRGDSATPDTLYIFLAWGGELHVCASYRNIGSIKSLCDRAREQVPVSQGQLGIANANAALGASRWNPGS